jgi:excinuclease UvrABC nuclease subunit
MKPLVWRAPADASGNFLPWLHALRNASGAYAIRNRETGAVLYVGESHTGRLAHTLKRHFYPWKDSPERPHATFQRGRVEVAVRPCPPAGAVGAQNNLIRRLNPRDNVNGTEPF